MSLMPVSMNLCICFLDRIYALVLKLLTNATKLVGDLTHIVLVSLHAPIMSATYALSFLATFGFFTITPCWFSGIDLLASNALVGLTSFSPPEAPSVAIGFSNLS